MQTSVVIVNPAGTGNSTRIYPRATEIKLEICAGTWHADIVSYSSTSEVVGAGSDQTILSGTGDCSHSAGSHANSNISHSGACGATDF